MHIYDEDQYLTRINTVELLSPKNASMEKTVITVEVYESQFKRFTKSYAEIAAEALKEMIHMGIIDSIETTHIHYIPYANMIFDHERLENQNLIFG